MQSEANTARAAERTDDEGRRIDQAMRRWRPIVRCCFAASLLALSNWIERGTGLVSKELEQVSKYTESIARIWKLLDPVTQPFQDRQTKFAALAEELCSSADPTYQHMAKTMMSFENGLFAGGDDSDLSMTALSWSERSVYPGATNGTSTATRTLAFV